MAHHCGEQPRSRRKPERQQVDAIEHPIPLVAEEGGIRSIQLATGSPSGACSCAGAGSRGSHLTADEATLPGAVACHSRREDAPEAIPGAGRDTGRDSDAASSKAEGQQRGKMGWASTREGSQSMQNPPAMAERLRLHTRPI